MRMEYGNTRMTSGHCISAAETLRNNNSVEGQHGHPIRSIASYVHAEGVMSGRLRRVAMESRGEDYSENMDDESEDQSH